MDIICSYDMCQCLSCKFTTIWLSLLATIPKDIVREICQKYIDDNQDNNLLFIKMIQICVDYYEYYKYCADKNYKTRASHELFWLEDKIIQRCQLGFSTCWVRIKTSIATIMEEYLITTAISELCNICVYNVVFERTKLDRTIYRWAKIGVCNIITLDGVVKHIVKINNNWLNMYISRAYNIIIDYINSLTEKIITGDHNDAKLIKFTYLKLGSTQGRNPRIYTVLLTANYSVIRTRARLNTI